MQLFRGKILKKKKTVKKLYDVEKEGYPPTFYTGRRAFYPVAPGLEEFLHEFSMNSILQEDKMVVFSNRSGKENELRIDPLVPTDEEINNVNDFHQEVGLIRRFYTNVSLENR
jgi:hypothetical protein